MMKRYAIYYVPPHGAFWQAGSAWLGWDAASGQPALHPDLAGVDLAGLTATPRKYGFHGTLKAPFRLAEGRTESDLTDAVAQLARSIPAFDLEALVVSSIGGRFLALRPEGDVTALRGLCDRLVVALEPFRAPLTEAEYARRKPEALTAHQRALLDQYGYPYVMDEFRFHITLSGDLEAEPLAQARIIAEAYFAPHLPRPFAMDTIALCGEAEDGRFHILSRHTLTG
ncbi:DUF1045 domain-containing protein [Donghicola sp. B5-SW-15]|uniref:DUF1045 domain-containing protein n=2 Tax=Donghicola mangrovi TaxID=2729614 RepID=A0A850QED7_9RHOB|nr:DUF1045 domain-containing protein [Donghicola mangrovi]NVO25290.1 DUF1045 domain-containing protein [Donghicola mangrovi]